ncbi:MAG: formate dehydrogenase family accessory protein FdhD [Gemmatimonadetes bacterium]|nr:formate dehydrogenase family accessory protein FdhD [Gemmatimonadota bacterium]
MTAPGPFPGIGLSAPTARHEPTDSVLAEEVPVALVYGGRSHVVVMCTPQDLEDLAVGFTLSESIVPTAADIGAVRVDRHSRGIEVHVEIPDAAVDALRDRARGMVSRSGCGLCGVEMIDDALRAVPRVGSQLTITREALYRAGRELEAAQAINRETRAVHAAAWATRDGEVVIAREDVGRHNALDKVIGALARSNRDARDGFLVVTSRASYELVQKCAVSGVELLAAVSRPTALAVRMAEAAGITLVGLLRGNEATVYCGGAIL